MRINLKLCFRNIYINGLENVPQNNPLILASNHPNSFLDGMIMDVILPRPLNIVIRGDAMKSKNANSFLKKLKLIPIHRLSEGKENLYKNDETFETCKIKLLKNEAIIIFSEGLCLHEKKLRPLKKGTARIILPFLENYSEKKLVVLPLGLNYNKFDLKKPDLLIQLGSPIILDEITQEFKVNQAKAINSFNHVLYDKLKELIIHFDEKENEIEFDKKILPQFKTHFINTFIKNNSLFNDLQNAIKNQGKNINVRNKKYNPITYYICLLFVKFSDLIYFPIKKSIQNLTDKKVSNVVFKNSVFISLNMILGFLYFFILNIIIGIVFGFKFFVISLILTFLFLNLLSLMQNYVVNYRKNKMPC